MKKDNYGSWEGSHEWYSNIVGKEGHHYHKHVIFPRLLPLLKLQSTSSLLDLGCGTGVLAHHLPKKVSYVGIDISPSLIRKAKEVKMQHARFLQGDVTRPLLIPKKDFTHAAFVLSFQNIADPVKALHNARLHLKEGGMLALVLNHPCFRIPRQSSWGVDLERKIQYRRIDRYLTPMEIPLLTHPGREMQNAKTISFHFPLSSYSRFLEEAGFRIVSMEEWCSDKVSTGKCAAMENRSRTEFPLFLTILCCKVGTELL